tara:strand:- start:242 stop:586 length:345 start_codon:yes stop_codon:yes gene_type:complete
MSVLDNEVNAKIVETKSIEANITIQKILDIINKHWEKCLNNYYVMESEPELSVDNYSDSITVNLNSSNEVNTEHIANDVAMLLEEELEELIRKKEAKRIADSKQPVEEGENGSL